MAEALVAYHGSESEKWSILLQLEAHAKADQIVQGVSWERGKGCAVGCTLHAYDHSLYEPRFGIPQMLARLEDCIFEGLHNGTAKKWPIRFMGAIKPGADLSRVGWQFLHWLLTDEKVNPGINHPLVRDAVKQCADVLAPMAKGLPADASAAESAASAARSAARSAAESAASAARSAAESAARSAESAAESAASAARSAARSAASAARSAAWSAAWSAAESAASAAERAAWSAESAAESAAWSAESAAESAAWSAAWSAASAAERAAWSAESAAERAAWSAESAAYSLMADKLVELVTAAGKEG